MNDEWEEYQKSLDHAYNKALSDVKTKILELRPGNRYLSDHQEGQQDLCDSLLDYIESLKNTPYAS